MPITLPKPAPSTVDLFVELTPKDARVSSKKLFGQPAAFVNGNLFLGTFGEIVFFRLAPEDRVRARRTPGVTAFEPMPGRAMAEYVAFPASVLEDRAQSREWARKALGYASGLPIKPAKARGRAARGGVRPPRSDPGRT